MKQPRPKLTAKQLEALREAVNERGMNAVAAELGMSRFGLASTLAGVARDGTVALALARIGNLKN